MTNSGMARAYRRQAGQILRQAKDALEAGAFGLAVRRSQETVELSLKAVLRYAGIETPKWHDVGDILKESRSRFPESFSCQIDRFAGYSADLRRKRERGLYGDEEAGKGPDEIFDRAQAEEAISWAAEVVNATVSLVGE